MCPGFFIARKYVQQASPRPPTCQDCQELSLKLPYRLCAIVGAVSPSILIIDHKIGDIEVPSKRFKCQLVVSSLLSYDIQVLTSKIKSYRIFPMFSINSRSIVQIKLRGTPHCTRNRSSIVYFRHHLKPSSKLPKVLNIIAGVVLNRKTFVRPAAAATSEWCTFGKKLREFFCEKFF